mmetsp:Transcript_135833/g.235650  ORF Transcript_135833/g.235650 Transcript_135833/m.235650 type:complete len:80 (+) Transcript_135833:428-667(+)
MTRRLQGELGKTENQRSKEISIGTHLKEKHILCMHMTNVGAESPQATLLFSRHPPTPSFWVEERKTMCKQAQTLCPCPK